MRVLPEKKHSLPTQPSGIGSGGMVPFEDDVSPVPFLFALILPFALYTMSSQHCTFLSRIMSAIAFRSGFVAWPFHHAAQRRTKCAGAPLT